ncbi:voltage-gated potassium channel [Lebetimonas natsushimae]|uniref:BK channel n=1 Tax=Lebetimonas natsushimae TaxID=1936991 RepID=A0A292YBP2_9BACT|nr:NAD-binding protein [Lebetimonas natsushimae]GAX87517.1 voltage-gated potassium channel [Lebetimonas natsushimae]
MKRESKLVKALVAFAFYLDGNEKYIKFKRKTDRLLNDPTYMPNKIFDIFMLILVSISVAILLYDVKHNINPFLEKFDFYVVTTIFVIEYILRVWVYNDIHKIILEEYEISSFLERGFDLKGVIFKIVKTKLEYMTTPFAIIDFLAILPAFRSLRIFRIFIIFRLFKILRYTNNLNIFLSVLKEKKFELFIVLIAVVFIVFIGGSIIYVFEAHINPNIKNLFDAYYWALITISTVGYGDISPVTQEGRTLTMFLIIVGVGIISFTTSIIASAFTEKLYEVKTEKVFREVDHYNEFYLICGFSDEAEILAEKLKKEKRDFLIVDTDENRVNDATIRGYEAVKGDITQKVFLKKINFNKITKIFVLTNSDITNTFITLTLRSFSKNAEIIALAHEEKNISKLEKVGANYVIVPTKATALLAGVYIGSPITFAVIDAILSEKKNAIIDEIKVIENSILDGKLIGEIDFDKYKILLFGVLKSKESEMLQKTFSLSKGHFYFNPPFDLKLEAGDIIVIMGYSVSINYFKYQIEKSSI